MRRRAVVQIDGCEHWWFEDRGPQCTLLVFVDDATSRLMRRLSIRYNGMELAYRTFDKLRQVDQAAIVDNKRLGVGIGDNPRPAASSRA